MKQIIPILFIFMFSSTSGITQVNYPVKKVYAYKQASIPGIIPNYSGDTDAKPSGTTVKVERKQNFAYWFYLSIPKKERITITGLWIDGKQYDWRSETINDLPVKKIIYTGLGMNDTIIMAPVTSNKIIQVYPLSKKTSDPKYVLNLARTNEVVIRYTWKGKTLYTSIRKVKELTPDVRV